MPGSHANSIALIINADDFGFFTAVSKGIVRCAQMGAISATGIMANGPRFDAVIDWLRDLTHIDIGVHLNLTYGEPLSRNGLRHRALPGGRFLPKMVTSALVLQKTLSVSDVKAEWRSQIDRCLDSGLKLQFLNSHEHIHILPPLTRVIHELAKEYGIAYIRYPRPEWKLHGLTAQKFLRNFLMQMTIGLNRNVPTAPSIQVLGIDVSGRLSFEYLSARLTALVPGQFYELMCHPGYFDPGEMKDHTLNHFHAWQQELAVLISPAFKALMRKHHLQLSHFSALKTDAKASRF